MKKFDFTIEIKSSSDKDTSLLASSVYDFLNKNAESVDFVKDRPTQDFGATLAVILGSAAAVAIAKGIADRIRRDRNCEVSITSAGGKTVVVSGVSEDAAERIFAALID